MRALLRPDTRKWDLLVLCVLPENTEMIFTVRDRADGIKYELSRIIESEKGKVGRQIMKKTGEKYPPFYGESYDRIIRDEAELDARWREIIESPVNAELAASPGEYAALYVCEEGLTVSDGSGKTA